MEMLEKRTSFFWFLLNKILHTGNAYILRAEYLSFDMALRGIYLVSLHCHVACTFDGSFFLSVHCTILFVYLALISSPKDE